MVCFSAISIPYNLFRFNRVNLLQIMQDTLYQDSIVQAKNIITLKTNTAQLLGTQKLF